MREQVLSGIKNLAINGVGYTNELPYDESGVPLYLKNPKKLYVDRTQYESTPVIQTLNGLNISNTTTSVSVYLSVDAKNSMLQLDDIINNLRGLEDTIVLDGTHTRESVVSTEYVEDNLVVTIEYRLTRIN